MKAAATASPRPVAAEFNTDRLAPGCAQLGIVLSAAQHAQLRRHLQLLAKWNRGLNLTAIHKADDMVTRHVLDCLAIAPFVRGQALLDIGSGGGFPGLPLAIAKPELRVTLLDSRGKRVEFLRHVCADLGLSNAAVVHRRVEDYRPARKFDTLAARAFAPLADAVAACAGLHRRDGRLLAMKGKMPEAEIAALQARRGGNAPAIAAGALSKTDAAGGGKLAAVKFNRLASKSLASKSPASKNIAFKSLTTERLDVPFLAAQRHLTIVQF